MSFEKINVKETYNLSRSIVADILEKDKKGQAPSKEELDALKGAFSKIVEFEKIYLVKCKDKFYGLILMEIDVEIDFTKRGVFDLNVKREPYILSVNPIFCADYNFSQFTGALISELLKLVYLHPATYTTLNSENDGSKHNDLNKASDAATYGIVKRDIRLETEDLHSSSANGCELPDDAYTNTSVNKDCKGNINTKSGMPLEYYYKVLRNFKSSDDTQQQSGEGESKSPSGNPSPNGVATPTNKNGTETNQWEDVDKSEVKSGIASMLGEILNSMSEQDRGYIPGGVMSQIEALMAPPKINWKDILRNMVGSIAVPYRSTRKKLNRRQPFRSDLYGRVPKHTVNIVCAIDTSGSMSDKAIAYCINEIFNIIKAYEGFEVTIIECDAEIGNIYQAKKPSDVKTKVTGRGGTSYLPVIDYINGTGDYYNNPNYPKAGTYREALMVYFTDGFGDSEIPRPRTYRNLWVIMDDVKNLSLSEPYGDVKSLSEDDDFNKAMQ